MTDPAQSMEQTADNVLSSQGSEKAVGLVRCVKMGAAAAILLVAAIKGTIAWVRSLTPRAPSAAVKVGDGPWKPAEVEKQPPAQTPAA